MTEKRVVLVTGGGQGIGRCLVRSFLEAGYRGAILETDRQAGEETAAILEGVGELLFVAGDVAVEEDAALAVARCLERFGRLDVLVNNAGVMLRKPLIELDIEEWNRVLAVNLTGAFLCAKHAAPALRQARGSILNIASTRALMSEPDTESYAASKGGMVALTHALALSLGPEIRVNAISPGWIETGPWQKEEKRREPQLGEEDHRQHPAGRVGRPEDVARLALFLADPANGFVTGQNFVVDGGMTRKMIYV